MTTNTKRNEHPACGCPQCRRGSRTPTGQIIRSLVNKKIRRKSKQDLKNTNPEDFLAVVVSTPYTD